MLHLALTLLIQTGPVDLGAQSAVDSARVHRDARRAQADFESQRRRRLPVTWGGYGGRCDVRVGRFCYWHDEGATPGPEEPASIAPLRHTLLQQLRVAADDLPGDGWIAGQRVRYLLEAGRPTEALRVATECRGDPWWCEALSGLVWHSQQGFAEADSAFARALAAMPSPVRCRWEDITDLLPGKSATDYRRKACLDRRAWAEELWALADPLWSVPGNDRRTEHYARHVMSSLERESRSTYQMSWGEDTHELLIRFGWPERWSRSQVSTVDATAVNVIGHEAHPAFDFWPGAEALAAPMRLAAGHFVWKGPDAVSRYAPAYARTVKPLDAQVTRFVRGDSMLVVAAFKPPNDTSFEGARLESALVVRGGSGAGHQVSSASTVLQVTVPLDSALGSLEVLARDRKSMARHREALTPPNRLMMGLLLYADPVATDGQLDDVITRMLPSLDVSRRERLGLYWEYSVPEVPIDSVTVVLSVYPRSASWLTRLARSMRLAEAAAPVHVRFTEPVKSRPSRTLGVDLSGLSTGVYDVRVRLEAGAREVGVTTRTIRLR